MKLRKVYAVVIGEIIHTTSTSLKHVKETLARIRKSEPSAYIVTYYG